MKIILTPRCALVGVIAFICFLALEIGQAAAIDIAPLTWTPRADWINVKSAPYNATGNGTTDDTTAIQGALNAMMANPFGNPKTIYFPAGTYKISSTLTITGIAGFNLIGCGLNTIIRWSGPSGGAMIWDNNTQDSRYLGFVWDGNSTAGCGVMEYGAGYITGMRHENESFRNFNVATGTYLPGHTQPVAGIVGGFAGPPVGEETIFNCRFYNCTTGVSNGVEITNNCMWHIDSCEFDNNGTGFSGYGTFDYILTNCHFQQSTLADIVGEASIQGKNLTSSGSAQFLFSGGQDFFFQDCWVDGWTNPAGAVELQLGGESTIADCTFTNPPSGAFGPIYTTVNTGDFQTLILSNITAPAFPPGLGLLHEYGAAPAIDWIPSGSLGQNMTSAAKTFLQSTYPADGPSILDVTKAPYTADPTYATDSTATIQAAINAAKALNNGSVVYIPMGFYKISSTLNVSGSNYSIQGEGFWTDLGWYGTSNNTIIAVTTPQNITIEDLRLGALDNYPGGPHYNSSLPTCIPTTINGIKETSTGASSATYTHVEYGGSNPGGGEINEDDSDGPGLVLSSLPAGSTVYIPILYSPLTVTDCGPAQILTKMAYCGVVTVSGATQPRTGFLGAMVLEGGQQSNPSAYNINITDNQNFVAEGYYSEQSANGIELQRGSGTVPGEVAIEGFNYETSPTSTQININNYNGRFFLGNTYLANNSGTVPDQIVQTGSNPIDFILSQNYFADGVPALTVGTGLTKIFEQNVGLTDSPSPITTAAALSMARSFDDFRQLGIVDLAVQSALSSPSGLVAYWKLDDTVSPSVDFSQSGTTGTWQNGPSYSTAVPSLIPYVDPGSLLLNGTNQCVNVGNRPNLPTAHSARTLCGWAKTNNTGSGNRWIASLGSPSTDSAMFIGMVGNTLCGGGFNDNLTVPGFWDTNWHFIALTYDGTTAKLYADGILKTSAAKTWNLVPSACYLGCQVSNLEFWNGNIDDVRIYNRALSAAEISNLAGTSVNPTLISGVSATSTSANVEGNPNLTASNNSLVAGPVTGILGASDSLGDSGFNGDDASDFGNFVTNLAGANITYDLGAKYNVNYLLVWNFSQIGFSTAGANSVQIQSSPDGVTFTTVGTYTFNQAPEAQYNSPRAIPGNNPPHPTGGTATEPSQVIPVTIANARYVKLVVNSNWGYSGGLVGINEVNFVGTPSTNTYDLANNFNITSDAVSNTWCYGIYTTLGSTGTFQITSSTNMSTTLLSGMDFWLLTSGTDPNIEKNVTTSPIFAANVDWLPGKVSFGPYLGPAVARFTAPTTGTYNITASFQTDQIRGSETSDGTTAYVYTGTTNVFTQALSDPGAAQFGTVANYTGTNVSLSAGQTVDFVVGGGAFTTQVSATATAVSP